MFYFQPTNTVLTDRPADRLLPLTLTTQALPQTVEKPSRHRPLPYFRAVNQWSTGCWSGRGTVSFGRSRWRFPVIVFFSLRNPSVCTHWQAISAEGPLSLFHWYNALFGCSQSTCHAFCVLGRSFRMYDAVFPEEEKDESGKANPAGVAGVGPTGQLNNVHSSYSSKHTSTDNLNNSNNNDNSNSNSKKNQNSHNSHNSRNSSQSERRQQYWPSFDPNGDTDRHATDRNIIEQYARPVVVSSTNSPALEPAGIGKDHTKSQGRPSFDPDRDPVAVQPSLRPRSNLTVPPGAGMVRIQGALEGRREGTAPSSDDPLPGPTSTYAGSREARGVARIFQKSTPPESTGNSEWDRHGGAVVGVAAGGGNNGWREQGSRDKDGYISGAPVGSRAGALEEADWGKPAQHLTPIHVSFVKWTVNAWNFVLRGGVGEY